MKHIILLIVILALLVFTVFAVREPFWDTYTPDPYLNQQVPRYGRFAAVVQIPAMLYDPGALPINGAL